MNGIETARIARRRETPLRLAMAACLLLGTASTAAGAAEPARDFPQRLYLGGSIGASKLEPDTRDTGYHQDDDNGEGATVTFGFDLSKRLSIEGFLSTLGEAGIAEDGSNTHAGGIDYEYAGFSAIGYLYNARGSADYPGYPDDEGYYRREGLSFYARLGLGKLDTSSDEVVHRQRKDWDLHLGGGFEYGWRNGFAARLEVVSFDEDAKMVSIGLIKRFGRSHSPLRKPETPTPVAVAMPPLTPAPPPPPEATPAISLPNILFDFDRHELTAEARRKLDGVAAFLRRHQGIGLRLNGHTDAIGTQRYNALLGQRRADSAARYLIDQGIEARRLETFSFGETRPVADNATATGRQLNRRVEFEVQQ